ncbi:MAG: DUF1460 domain-containing protein [Tannerella sp.]|jgi:cell wall-associated NlpC family hydrolase|nr:DUF1460 domain-containing protein [Tannerella sp.]
MIFNTKILIAGFLLLCVSCSGKSGTKIQLQEEQTASIQEEGFCSVVEPEDPESLSIEIFYSTDTDRIIFDNYVTYIEPFKHNPISELVIETARFFLNKPYVASTLEFEPEGLVVNLREFDCTTFVETVLALSYIVKMHDDPAFEDFCKQLQYMRYRRGVINNYMDRLHYFSDWIYENENRGFVKDITGAIGGEPYRFDLYYISSHPDNYNQIKSHPEYVEVIRRKENEISERNLYSCILKTKMTSGEKEMRDGDIVCFVTDIEGLDVSHVGFIYHENEEITFIHASTSAKKVIINPQTLSVYIGKSKRNAGLMVVRPLFSE